jgi:hypothetical protein
LVNPHIRKHHPIKFSIEGVYTIGASDFVLHVSIQPAGKAIEQMTGNYVAAQGFEIPLNLRSKVEPRLALSKHEYSLRLK